MRPLLSVIIPSSTALAAYGPPVGQRASMLVETRLGAAQLVARQAPLALRPQEPQRFKAVAPPDPTTLRGGVAGDLNVLFLLLAAISLVIGAVGIANTTLVAVLERTAEIGLRRSLGARPVHIAGQFLTESAALGTLGGLVGTSLGGGRGGRRGARPAMDRGARPLDGPARAGHRYGRGPACRALPGGARRAHRAGPGAASLSTR